MGEIAICFQRRYADGLIISLCILWEMCVFNLPLNISLVESHAHYRLKESVFSV